MKPLLSVVIATKNRQKYAVHAVESILSLQCESIQVVVQDNSDAIGLEEMLNRFKDDRRLVYRYTPPPFSSIDNFNAAVDLSTGEYICLIGDDDGINPDIIRAATWAREYNIDAVVGRLCANYRWEGTGAPDTLFTKMVGGALTITHFSGKIEYPDVKHSLIKLMKNGCTNYLDFSFPKLYHGLIKRECMERIKARTGDYLKGLSPDIYSAVALACVINKLATVDYPLTIPGVCAESTSITEGQIKKHSRRLEDAPHFRDRGVYNWSQNVPTFYCVQTIWADSGFAALREMNRDDLVDKFNRHSLYANILAANWSTISDLFKYLRKTNKDRTISLLKDIVLTSYSLIVGPFKKFIVRRLVNRARIIIGLNSLVIIEHLADIHMAMNSLTTYLDKKNIERKDSLFR